MPMNQHDKMLPASQLNSLSTLNYNDRNIQVERKAITEIHGWYSQIMSTAMDNGAEDHQNMAIEEKETKETARFNIHGFKISKSPESRIGSQDYKDGKLLLSVVKRDAKSKTIESSNKSLEGTTLETKYDVTTFQNKTITKAQSNSDSVSQIHGILDLSQKEIWFVSDGGSDRYDCQTASAPCRNLQTVLNRASDSADIYVTSETLSLDLVNDTVWYKMAFWGNYAKTGSCCLINSSLSYTLRSISRNKTDIKCSSEYLSLLP